MLTYLLTYLLTYFVYVFISSCNKCIKLRKEKLCKFKKKLGEIIKDKFTTNYKDVNNLEWNINSDNYVGIDNGAF